jgi:hypothetical protein
MRNLGAWSVPACSTSHRPSIHVARDKCATSRNRGATPGRASGSVDLGFAGEDKFGVVVDVGLEVVVSHRAEELSEPALVEMDD